MNEKNNTSLASPLLHFAAIIIIIAGIKMSSTIILPLLLALFISIVCAQPILWLMKKKIPDWASILIVLAGVIILLVLMASIIGTSLSRFTMNLPHYEASLNRIVNSFNHRFELMDINVNLDQVISSIDTKKILQFTSGLLGQLGALMSNSFLILLITIFVLAEMKIAYLKADLIEKKFGKSLGYLDEVAEKIRHYLSLKTVISLITGVFISIWLKIVGVEYAILWGVIAFLLNYIPNIGSIIAAVPTMLLALVDLGVGGFMWTGIGYLLVNVIMGSIIEPRIMGKGMGLSTLTVFISLIIWGYIFGAVGMFLSIPITISIKIILEKNKKTQWIAWLLASEQEINKIIECE